MNCIQKLAFPLVCIMPFGAVAAAVSLRGAKTVRTDLVAGAESVAAIGRLRNLAERLLSSDPGLVQHCKPAQTAFAAEIEKLGSLRPPVLIDALEPLERATDQYVEFIRAAVDRRSKTQDAQELSALAHEERLLSLVFESRLDDVVRLVDADFAPVTQTSTDMSRSPTLFVAWLVTSGCLVAAFLWLLAIQQARPVHRSSVHRCEGSSSLGFFARSFSSK